MGAVTLAQVASWGPAEAAASLTKRLSWEFQPEEELTSDALPAAGLAGG